MKLRNKKTGEIVDLSEGFIKDTYCGEKIMIKPVAISNKEGYVYNSLAELNEEWEDATEEPKGYWLIDWTSENGLSNFRDSDDDVDEFNKSIGNYFEALEEAELAVRKLKAWKRLKDKGFRFNGWIREHKKGSADITIASFIDDDYDITNDLDLLFGGEE